MDGHQDMGYNSDEELLQMVNNAYSSSRRARSEYEKMLQDMLVHGQAAAEAESSRAQSTRRWKPRKREAADALLREHYFDDDHLYPDDDFLRRYRMSKSMFLRIVEGIKNYNSNPIPDHFRWFQVGVDRTGRSPISIYQKCTAAVRQLAYGIPGDATDEYLQMGETTALKTLDYFCHCVQDLFTDVYLRKPTAEDIQRLYEKHNQVHGLPGMLGSIDCMHWAWKNCPVSWRGQFKRGDHGYPTIMLEAVASYDLWIWHAFFGVAGANNDINVLQQSPLLNDLLMDAAPPSAFTVNGTEYRHGYYLADGIYPEWSTFVKSFSVGHDERSALFKRVQEGARKDVERAFGGLQGKWVIVSNPARAWSIEKMSRIMYTCIILHNMCVEENGYAIGTVTPLYRQPTNLSGRTFEEISLARIENSQRVRHRDTHRDLRRDLAQHVWEHRQFNH